MKPRTTRLPLLAALLLMLCAFPSWADGTLTHLSGPVSVQKADGSTLPGMAGTKVLAGDTVITGAGGYGRMEMSDGGEMVLRPGSQLKIERYRFEPAKPADDSFVFQVLKGGFRTITGLIGKRGDKDAYQANTASATIGIRGTQYDLRLCQGDCGALRDGTYVAVRFGAVAAGNTAGQRDFSAGQVGLVPPNQPPVVLPRDPGIGFTPPPVIPKLDERKRQSAAPQASAPAGQPAAAASGGSPAAAKPANASEKAPASSASGASSGGTAASSGAGQAGGSPSTAAGAGAATGTNCSVE